MRAKRVAIALLIALFAYLSVYTWNLRTGHVDALANYTGLEFIGLVVKPGQWAADEAVSFWERYVYLVGLKEENEKLRDELQDMRLRAAELHETAAAVQRLERLLHFSPHPAWVREGARVIMHRLGPEAALETLVVDKGRISGVAEDTPVAAPKGVVGRVMRAGASISTVLLLTDLNSRIAVRGGAHRSTGILIGMGPEAEESHPLLQVRYVNLNAPLDVGETLVTSGLAGIFPPGLPVARVTSIERSSVSLFLDVRARPLVNLKRLEEVLLLLRDPQYQAEKE
ncbi:MAG: rod shape-determining protein MreC [Desulfovibrionaceae bacterium]